MCLATIRLQLEAIHINVCSSTNAFVNFRLNWDFWNLSPMNILVYWKLLLTKAGHNGAMKGKVGRDKHMKEEQ